MKTVQELQAKAIASSRKASHAMERALAFAELVGPGDPQRDVDFVSRKMREAQALDGIARKDAADLARAKLLRKGQK